MLEPVWLNTNVPQRHREPVWDQARSTRMGKIMRKMDVFVFDDVVASQPKSLIQTPCVPSLVDIGMLTSLMVLIIRSMCQTCFRLDAIPEMVFRFEGVG